MTLLPGEVVRLGGTMRKNSVSVIGHYAENMPATLSCDKLFIGVDGIDMDYGLTTSDMNEAQVFAVETVQINLHIMIITTFDKFSYQK